jgi:hypothetical protein
MSKHNRRKNRGRSTSPFIMLHWHLVDSQGWHELSPHARLAYIELCRLYNGENNGRIGLSARRLACQMPCDKATASRALRELEDAGFVQTMRLGNFARKDRLASEYRLTNFKCDVTGDLPSRRWNIDRWQPSDGQSRSYRTGAKTAHSESQPPSTVRPNRPVHDHIAPSTVRADRTHLESSHWSMASSKRNETATADAAAPLSPQHLNMVWSWIGRPRSYLHEEIVSPQPIPPMMA